jgi:hypothetical protein
LLHVFLQLLCSLFHRCQLAHQVRTFRVPGEVCLGFVSFRFIVIEAQIFPSSWSV